MAEVNDNKLKELLTSVVAATGTVATTGYLKVCGYSDPLLYHYKENNWITSLGHGAYCKANDEPRWTGGLSAIQKQLELPIHVGGKTALSLKGITQNVPLRGLESIDLFSPPNVNLPQWFREAKWGLKINHHTTSFLPFEKRPGLTEFEDGTQNFFGSTPERAALELCHLVPKHQSFEEAAQIIESLTTLRPDLVEKLLHLSTSIKVNRIFLFLVDRSKHEWLMDVNQKRIDLGSGDREITKGGVYDSKYRITVPEELLRGIRE